MGRSCCRPRILHPFRTLPLKVTWWASHWGQTKIARKAVLPSHRLSEGSDCMYRGTGTISLCVRRHELFRTARSVCSLTHVYPCARLCMAPTRTARNLSCSPSGGCLLGQVDINAPSRLGRVPLATDSGDLSSILFCELYDPA